MLSRCERIFLQVAEIYQRFRRAETMMNATLDLKKQNLLATDPDTRSQRSVADREAMTTKKLLAEVQEVSRLELAVNELDAVLTVIKAKRSDLRDVQARLRDQIRLCQEEMGLGSRWGSKRPDAPPLDEGSGVATGADVEAITDLLGDVDGEIHLAQQKGEWDGDSEEVGQVGEAPTEVVEPEVVEPEAPEAELVDLGLEEMDPTIPIPGGKDQPKDQPKEHEEPVDPEGHPEGHPEQPAASATTEETEDLLDDLPDPDPLQKRGFAPLDDNALDVLLEGFDEVDD